MGPFRLFRLFKGGHIWPLFFITCGFWLIGLPIGEFMLFIAFRLFNGLLPNRAPGFGARFGEFIPRCGLELPIYYQIAQKNLNNDIPKRVVVIFLPATRLPLRPIPGELTAKLGLELPMREPFGEFMLFRCEFGVLFIWASCPRGFMEDILELVFAFMAFIAPAFMPFPGIIIPRLLCIGPSMWLASPKVLFLLTEANA